MAKRGRKKAKDDKGYLDSNKKNHTDYKVINGNKITMEGVSGKIYAIPIDKNGQAGKGRLMNPGENHEFEGAAHIIEVPETQMAQTGLNTGDSNFVQNFGNQFMDVAEGIGSFVGGKVDEDFAAFKRNWEGDKRFFGEQMNPDNWATNTPMEGTPSGARWEAGAGNSRAPENPLPSQNPESYPTPQQGIDFTPNRPVPQQIGEVTETPIPKQIGDLTETPTPQVGDLTETRTETGEEVEATSDQGEIDPTKKIQFHNPYGGVDLNSASHILGKSFGYEGDQTGANTARGVGSGLKLLAGLGRNIMSGVGQEKRNQYLTNEANEKLRNSDRTTVSRQSGGKITNKDVSAIGEATGLDFNLETANRLFGHTPQQSTTPQQEIDFGKYKDVGYFESGEMHNGKRVIYNTDRNPMNYDDNRRNALDYLRELNGDNFEFQYRDKTRPQTNQVVSRQKGGEVKAADLLSGAYMTGDPNSIPNVEVEKGEHVKDNQTGQVQEVVGNKHSQGGEKMNLPDHSVLSDYNKIGGDLAKKYRDEFDIKVKAKDTFATAFDRVLKKTGYKSKADELTEYIEKTEKEQEKAKKSDSEATTGINMTFLSGKINDLTKELEPLEEVKSNVFETMFEDQQGKKSAKELREEGSEMAEGGETGENESEPMSRAYNYLISKGLEPHMVAGILGNFMQESGLDPTAHNPNDMGKPSFGLAQWRGDRLDRLRDFAGDDINNLETQLDFMLHEFETTEKAAYEALKDTTNVQEAANVFSSKFERPHKDYAHNDKRVAHATRFYDDFGEGEALPDVPEELSTPRNTKKGSVENPWTSNPDLDFIREDFDTDQPLTNVDGSEYEEGEDITETREFREWFHNNKAASTLDDPTRLDLDIPEINAPNIDAPISEEERRRRAEANAPEEEDLNEEVVDNGDGTEYQTMLLPDQTPLPPSAMQPHRLGEVSPREAEANLISPEAQIEEINRQAQAARKNINSLPDSQRRAALAQLNSRTQQSINQVMSQTNRANNQVQNQVEQLNTQIQNQAETMNENLAQSYEQKALTAKDKTENEVRAFFNRLDQNQIGNKLTIDELNAANANNSSYQYNAAGEFEQVANPDLKGMANNVSWMQGYADSLSEEQREELRKSLEKKSKSAKRGRKTK